MDFKHDSDLKLMNKLARDMWEIGMKFLFDVRRGKIPQVYVQKFS